MGLKEAMPKRVVINLDILRADPDCKAECSYPFQKPGALAGPSWLKQKAAFEVFCRRCDDHPCVDACPFEALEQMEDGQIKRYNMRCTQCNSCMIACPFGTIIPAALVYRDAMCDLCVGRDAPAPLCTTSCDCGAYRWEDVSDEDPQKDAGLFIVNGRMAVRTKKFTKVEPPLVRKKK